MKNMSLVILFALSAGTANAQHYVPVEKDSKVSFNVVNHMLIKSTVDGSLSDLKGNITFDPLNPANASFDVTVAVATIKTGISLRDKDLKKETYFDVAKFPLIHIVSKHVERNGGPGKFILYGTLIIKGMTKPITISFTTTQEPGGLLFKGNCTVNRLDFNVGGKGKIEDQVKVDLLVHTRKV